MGSRRVAVSFHSSSFCHSTQARLSRQRRVSGSMTSLWEATAVAWAAPEEAQKSRGRHPDSSNATPFTLTLGDVVAATYTSALNMGTSISTAVAGLLKHKPARTPLQQVEWVQCLEAEHAYHQVLGKTQLTAKGGLFPEDNLFKNMTRKGMLLDNVVMFKSGPSLRHQIEGDTQHSCEVVAVYLLGHGVCGHAGVVHGGMTSALIDETCGYLVYLARNEGVLDFKAVLTASLEVSYKKPLTPDKPVVITAYISALQGRKIWVEVRVTDKPDCLCSSNNDTPSASSNSLQAGEGSEQASQQLYATGKALFIIPRADSASAAALEKAGKGRALLGTSRPKEEGNTADV